MLSQKIRLVSKMKYTIIYFASILCLPTATVQAAPDTPVQKTLSPRTADVRVKETLTVEKKISLLLHTSKTFEQLASQPLPEGLQKDKIKEAQRYERWLRKTSKELKQLADQWQADVGMTNTLKQMQEMQKSFNLQYLMLQNKISHENRQFTMISNIMKNKHDTAKNAINNLR